MPGQFTHIQPILAEDFPELLVSNIMLEIRYSFYPEEPDVGAGSGIEIVSVHVSGINGHKRNLREYPQLFEAFITDELEEKILETHLRAYAGPGSVG